MALKLLLRLAYAYDSIYEGVTCSFHYSTPFIYKPVQCLSILLTANLTNTHNLAGW